MFAREAIWSQLVRLTAKLTWDSKREVSIRVPLPVLPRWMRAARMPEVA
jgi:hypothetical protein